MSIAIFGYNISVFSFTHVSFCFPLLVRGSLGVVLLNLWHTCELTPDLQSNDINFVLCMLDHCKIMQLNFFSSLFLKGCL